MRVLISIFEELYPLSGGGSPRISNLCRAFSRAGHEVIAAGGFAAPAAEVKSRLGCAEVIRLKSVSRLDPGKMKKYLTAHPVNLARMVSAMRRFRPDLVVSHNTIAGWGAILGKRLGAKKPLLVLDLTDVLFEYLDDYRAGAWLQAAQALGRRMERAALRGSDRIITISEAMKKIVAAYGVSPDRVGVVCDGVDFGIFRQTDESARRAELAPGADSVILFQGVIDPQDGPDLLAAAAAAILQKHPGARFWIVGEGSAVPGLKKLVKEMGIAGSFFFSGWVTQAEVARYLSAGDIGLVILPDILSARGRVTLKEFEYWACGLSVVAPRLSALEEVIREGENGLFYPAGDARALADCVNRLIEDPALSRKLAEAGKKLSEESYRWDRLADRFVSLCESYSRLKTEG